MPKVLYANDGVRESVTRPIVFDIARQIQEHTGLKDINILFPGDSEVALQPGSTITDEPDFNRASSSALWRINIKEEHQNDKLLATAVHQLEHAEFFFDDKLGVFMKPVYSPTVLTLEFEYRSTDVNAARRWRDEFRAKVSTNRDVRTHIINYAYLIPMEFFPLLQHIHALREAQAGYGEDFITYLRSHFTQNVTSLTTVAGTAERWAIAEQQGRCVGQFEFAELPDEPNKQGDNSAYRVTFSYKVHYDCPIAVAGTYPILVHNQLIDDQFIMHQPKDDLQRFESRSPRSVTALGAFEVDRLARPTIKSGIRLPEFHEFYPRTAPRSTLQILSALVGIEPIDETTNNRTIMNFNEIDERWEFRPEFITYLKKDAQWINKYGESFINLTVYDNDMPMHFSRFRVTENLDVILNEEPDLRRTYYVRLALLTDPSELSQGAKDRAREDANGVTLIGAALCPRLVTDKKLPEVLGDSNYLSRRVGEKFFDDIRFCTIGHQGGIHADHAVVQWNTVMILFIETDSKDQLKNQE